jgi:hypothetical protein
MSLREVTLVMTHKSVHGERMDTIEPPTPLGGKMPGAADMLSFGFPPISWPLLQTLAGQAKESFQNVLKLSDEFSAPQACTR